MPNPANATGFTTAMNKHRANAASGAFESHVSYNLRCLYVLVYTSLCILFTYMAYKHLYAYFIHNLSMYVYTGSAGPAGCSQPDPAAREKKRI